jgi:acyl-CoA synthetase (NDP forming)
MTEANDFFNAESFAVVGASRDENKVGGTVFKNLLKSGKKVFPVNPKATQIKNHRCFEDILEIPHNIDCVVFAIPAKLVPEILRKSRKRNVKSAVILSAGFSEIGNGKLEEQILRIAEEENIKLLGPNCYGFIDPIKKVSTSYFEGLPQPGKIAFISQSGAIGSAVLDKNIKLSGFVSVGNSAQLDVTDFIQYYSSHKETEVITIYLESLKKDKGKKFIEVCQKSKKPIIILKSGKSESGQHAAASHTAALASESGVYEGILRQAKCIQVDSIKELFNVATIISKYGKIGKNAAIVTNAGGLGVLTTDYCEQNNIHIAPLSKSLIEKLNPHLHENWSRNNPIDIIGSATSRDYANALSIIQNEKFDLIIVLLTPQKMTEGLKTAKLLLKLKKPVLTCFLGGRQTIEARKFMKQFGILNFTDPKELCDTLGKIIQ